jgi:hypothetical protein
MKNTLVLLLFCFVAINSEHLYAQNTEMDAQMKAWTPT